MADLRAGGSINKALFNMAKNCAMKCREVKNFPSTCSCVAAFLAYLVLKDAQNKSRSIGIFLIIIEIEAILFENVFMLADRFEEGAEHNSSHFH